MNVLRWNSREDYVVNYSIALLVASGIAILTIDQKTSARKKRLAASLNRGLWKLTDSVSNHDKNYFRWNEIKLFCAGIMVATTVTCTSVRIVKVRIALALGISVLTMWTIFLVFFLDSFLAPKLLTPYNYANGSEKESEPLDKDGWEARIKKRKEEDNRLPVTIITGFLGSGKTTLVKRILENTIGLKILVIENEIGSEGIDHELLVKHTAKEEIILMNNGCICCTVRKDVIFTFHKMFSDPSFALLNWVVIETTGLADPAPLIQSLYMDKYCAEMLRLDSVLTIVDVKHLPLHLQAEKRGESGAHGQTMEAVQQIAYADRILLNKIDLVSQIELDDVTDAVRELNPTAQLLTCKYSDLPVEELLNIRAFDPSRNAALLTGASINDEQEKEPMMIPTTSDGKIKATRVRVALKKKCELGTFEVVPGGSRVTTVSLVTEDPLDLDAFNLWVSYLIKVHGNSIYRLKGILSMKGYDKQFVAQGIHMIFDGELGSKWPEGQPRRSKLVLIGLDLDAASLEEQFLKCRATN